MAKTPAENQKKYREKLKSLGYEPVFFWVLPEWKVRLKELLQQLRGEK